MSCDDCAAGTVNEDSLASFIDDKEETFDVI